MLSLRAAVTAASDLEEHGMGCGGDVEGGLTVWQWRL